MASSLIEHVAGLDGALLVLIVALLAYGETAMFAGLIVPGEVGMVVGGAAAKAADMPLPLIIAGAIVGAILGDSTSYWLGRTVGERLVCRWEPIRRRMEPKLETSKKHFEDKGGASVFFGRFVGALRAVVPMTAGMSKMAFGRFLMWNVAASIIWAGGIVSIGYVVGKPAAKVFDRYALAFTAAIVVLVGVAYLVRRARRSAPTTA